MKGSINLSMLVGMFFLFSCNKNFGQVEAIKVSKQPCTLKYSALDVEVKKDGVLLDSLRRKHYDFASIYKLHDSIKLKVVECLLKFASDTLVCCNSVQSYDNVEYPGCYNVSPLSNSFSIRIEALFIINRIAYNPLSYRIGCYPVLYDSEKKQEINNNNCLINLMVEHYQEWFRMYKNTGKLPDYNFLNEGRIKWWGRHL